MVKVTEQFILVAFKDHINGVILFRTSDCWRSRRKQNRKLGKLIDESRRKDMSTTRLLLVALLLALLTMYCLASPKQHFSGSRTEKREVKINANDANFFLSKKRQGRGLTEECDEGCDHEEIEEVREDEAEEIEEIHEKKKRNNWWR